MKAYNNDQLKDIVIVEARKRHVAEISELTRGENLRYRPPEEIDSCISNFLVAMNKKKEVVGCVGSKLYELNMEIIALRNPKEFRNPGLGKILLKQKIQELKKWGRLNIFAVTTEAVANRLFFPLGFIEVGIQLFGPKVLTDCLVCPKNKMEGKVHLCNEIAVLYKD